MALTISGDGQLTGPVLFDTVADIASATSIDLTAYGSGFIATVTGTTPTTTFVMSDGQFGTLVAEGAWPLTYHATTNKLVGGADVTAYAGQYFRVSKTGGVVSCEPIAPKAIYGGMILTAVATPSAATFTKAAVSAASFGNSGVTFTDANDETTILSGGMYLPTIKFVAVGTAAGVLVLAQMYVDGVSAGDDYAAVSDVQASSATTLFTASASAPIRLSAGQVVSLYLYCASATVTFSATYTSLSLHKIGE